MLDWPHINVYLFIYISFIVCVFFCRELDAGGQNAFSKCKMYDVNLTTIQSWDYAEWNSTKHHEKHMVLGKYWIFVRRNQTKQLFKSKNERKRMCETERKSETNRKESRPCLLARCNRRVSNCSFSAAWHRILFEPTSTRTVHKTNTNPSYVPEFYGNNEMEIGDVGITGQSFALKFTPNASNAFAKVRYGEWCSEQSRQKFENFS